MTAQPSIRAAIVLLANLSCASVFAQVNGDFNNDGFADLAIGAPGESYSDFREAGAVNVIYGSADGLVKDGNQRWHQNISGIPDALESDDLFGHALAVGDFDDDGFDDLAIGVPGEDIGAVDAAGAVNVLYGSPGGLVASGSQFWHQDSGGVAEVAEAHDRFGSSLASGDFDGDGIDDLAIGVPGESVGPHTSAGAVHILFGTPAGLKATNDQYWTQNSPDVLDNAEPFDNMGVALVAGDFDNDNFDDLAIGVGEDLLSFAADVELITFGDEGSVAVLYGSPMGLSAVGNQVWHQDVPGIRGVSGVFELFGFSLAAGDFNNDGFDDLAIGVPNDDESVSRCGAVNVLYGSVSGLSKDDNQKWDQDSSGVVDSAESNDAFGFSVCTGDFDNDGFADLAVGIRGEGIGMLTDVGAVHVLYGSADRLTADGDQLWHQNSSGVFDQIEDADQFGWSVGAGDFDNDSMDDLAIGVPFEDLPLRPGQTITSVSVTFNQLSHTRPDDLDMMLVGPTGAAITLMSDVGGDTDINFPGVTMTLSSQASTGMLDDGPLTSGTFLPTDIDPGANDTFDAPAPPESGSTSFATFSGTNPLGTWSLYVMDDTAGDSGAVSSWRLIIEGIDEVFGSGSGLVFPSGPGPASTYPSIVEITGIRDAGAINLLYGSPVGLDAAGNQFLHQDTAHIVDASEFNDRLGGVSQ